VHNKLKQLGLIFASIKIFAQLVISLNLVLAGLRLGLKNCQVGEKWISDDCSYLCKGLQIMLNAVNVQKYP
jgi:hypothetical protein